MSEAFKEGTDTFLRKLNRGKREEELSVDKHKAMVLMGFIIGFVVLAISGLVVGQLNKNHAANERIIEECFNNFNKVESLVITKEGPWSPVTCEKK